MFRMVVSIFNSMAPVLFAVGVGWLLFFILFRINPLFFTGSDFVAYITGGLMVREGKGAQLYSLDSQFMYQLEAIEPYTREKLLPFRYPSFVGLLFAPLSFFSFVTSYKIFAFVNIILLIVLVALCFTFVKGLSKVFLLIPLVYFQSVYAILLGQTSFILAIAYLLIFYLLKTKKAFVAGIVFSAMLLKPQYVVTALPFLLLLSPNRPQFLKGFFIPALALLFLSLYISGSHALFTYPQLLFSTENTQLGSTLHYMFTVSSSLLSVIGASPFGYYVFAFNGLLYIVMLLVFIKRYTLVQFEQSFVSATLLFLVFSMHVLGHDLTILLPSIFILLGLVVREQGRKKVFFGSIVTLLVLLPTLSERISPVFTTWVFLVIAVLLLFYPKLKLS